MWCCVVLCCAVLFCVVLCSVVLCCVQPWAAAGQGHTEQWITPWWKVGCGSSDVLSRKRTDLYILKENQQKPWAFCSLLLKETELCHAPSRWYSKCAVLLNCNQFRNTASCCLDREHVKWGSEGSKSESVAMFITGFKDPDFQELIASTFIHISRKVLHLRIIVSWFTFCPRSYLSWKGSDDVIV